VQNSIDQFLLDLIDWLNRLLPLYWLVAAVGAMCLYIFFSTRQNRKKLQRLNAEREKLSLARASNTQKIETLEVENNLLNTKVNSNAVQISRLVAETAELNSSRNEKTLQLSENEKERLGLREMHENNQRKITRLEADIAKKQERLQSEQDKLSELKAQFEQQKRELKNEFKVVSEEIIKERQAMLTEHNKEGVGALLKPLQAQIEGFQKRINEVHDESVKGNTNLKAEIENVMNMGIKMRDEASNLTTALKGDSQQKGAWGEAQLERTLELSGLVEYDHYEKQSEFKDDVGRSKRTDYLIKLPGEKCMIIDSKVSLNAYERAVNASQEDQSRLMSEHVALVRKYIVDLASKDYTNLEGVQSPDFVLMFMPIEPAYIEAMKHDRELFNFGFQRNVVMVSNTTLIPILRTVANLWMLDQSNKKAREISDKAADIYNKVVSVSDNVLRLGQSLNTASKRYKETVDSLSSVQGLHGKVKRFKELSNKAKKSMPEMQEQNLDFDTTRLEAQALENAPKKDDDGEG